MIRSDVGDVNPVANDLDATTRKRWAMQIYFFGLKTTPHNIWTWFFSWPYRSLLLNQMEIPYIWNVHTELQSRAFPTTKWWSSTAWIEHLHDFLPFEPDEMHIWHRSLDPWSCTEYFVSVLILFLRLSFVLHAACDMLFMDHHLLRQLCYYIIGKGKGLAPSSGHWPPFLLSFGTRRFMIHLILAYQIINQLSFLFSKRNNMMMSTYHALVRHTFMVSSASLISFFINYIEYSFTYLYWQLYVIYWLDLWIRSSRSIYIDRWSMQSSLSPCLIISSTPQ